MPMATISVTEDMATCMRLHGLGWRSVYHHEVLARGLAPGGPGHDAAAAAALGAGHHAGDAAGEPAGAARAEPRAAAHVLRDDVELPLRLRGAGLHRRPGPLPDVRRPAGRAFNVDFLVRFCPSSLLNQLLVLRRRPRRQRGAATSTASPCSRCGSGRASPRSPTSGPAEPWASSSRPRRGRRRSARSGRWSDPSSWRWGCW